MRRPTREQTTHTRLRPESGCSLWKLMLSLAITCTFCSAFARRKPLCTLPPISWYASWVLNWRCDTDLTPGVTSTTCDASGGWCALGVVGLPGRLHLWTCCSRRSVAASSQHPGHQRLLDDVSRSVLDSKCCSVSGQSAYPATIVRSDVWRNCNSPRRSLPTFFRGYPRLLLRTVPHAYVDFFNKSQQFDTTEKIVRRCGVPCHGTESTASSQRCNQVHVQPSCHHSAHRQ